MKPKNHIDPKTGKFICTKCGSIAVIGEIRRGYVYCTQCVKGMK